MIASKGVIFDASHNLPKFDPSLNLDKKTSKSNNIEQIISKRVHKIKQTKHKLNPIKTRVKKTKINPKNSLFNTLSKDTITSISSAITSSACLQDEGQIIKFSLSKSGRIEKIHNSLANIALLNSITVPKQIKKLSGIALCIIGIGYLLGPLTPYLKLEAAYAFDNIKLAINESIYNEVDKSNSANIVHENGNFPSALKTPEGNPIVPVNNDFAIIIPKIHVNAPIIPNVDPLNTKSYTEALKNGVAHSALSHVPSEGGTTYLFSHSTNYEWFIKDLNAIFYLTNKLETGDTIVIMYLGKEYTYAVRDKKVVSKNETSYLKPQPGANMLILQTCTPPGTAIKRLLIFADLVRIK